MKKRFWIPVASGLLFLPSLVVAQAPYSASWNKTGTAAWDDPLNWTWSGGVKSPTELPDAQTTVTLSNGGTVQVSNTEQLGVSMNLSTGRLEIINAGKLTISGAFTLSGSGTGSILVDGLGSELIKGNTTSTQFQVGGGGVGTLTIQNQGKFTAGAAVHIGLGNGTGTAGQGTLTVSTGGQAVLSSLLMVGYRGTGTVNVESGGYLKTNAGYLAGYGPDSNRIRGTAKATVTGQNSLWDTGNLFVGHTGTGTLTVTDGGRVISTAVVYIGHRNDGPIPPAEALPPTSGTGTAWVSDGGLLQAVSGIQVGSFGEGTLQVSSNGIARVNGGAGNITLGVSASATGTLLIGGNPFVETPTPLAPGILDAATVTSGASVGDKSIHLYHNDMTGNYALTKNGLVGGTAVLITGNVRLNAQAGVTTLKGANTYSMGTFIGGDDVAEARLIAAHSQALGSGPVFISERGTLQVADSLPYLMLNSDLEMYSGSGLAIKVDALGGNGSQRIELANFGALILPEDPEARITLHVTGTNLITANPELYDWTFLVAGGGIANFTPDLFEIITDGLAMHVFQDGNSLVLGVVIPEPSRTLTFLLGGLLCLRRRRR